MKHILHIIGARPNVMKLGPLWHALHARGIPQRVLHTGQHYDPAMSAELFEDFRLPEPDVHLGAGALAAAHQFAAVVEGVAGEIDRARPGLVVAYGDVRSTPAAAIAAYYSGVRSAHYEAGLRAHTRAMPEEMNRITADVFCDVLWLTAPHAVENIRGLGLADVEMHVVGNLMADAVRMMGTEVRVADVLARSGAADVVNGSQAGAGFAVMTCHREATVESRAAMEAVCAIARDVGAKLPLVFVLHPRTQKKLDAAGLLAPLTAAGGIAIVPALRYRDFIALVRGARVLVSDSGGLVVEAACLGVPHLMLRDRTEHAEDGLRGALAVGLDRGAVARALDEALAGRVQVSHPPLWDGKAAERIAGLVAAELSKSA
jgi:UDP-N-acetylglucosamine 2-epimerase (non-hydrolysing)